MIDIPEIIGQDVISDLFNRALKGGRIPHALIIGGEKDSGKLEIARAFAMEAIGTNNPEHNDIRIIEFPKTTPKYVDTIRIQVINDMQLMPLGDTHKFYIIKDAQVMTAQAQNALLKSLEEPPEYAHIILLTDDAGKLLPTIRSRSIYLYLKPVETEIIKNQLIKEEVDSDRALISAALSMGNLNKARRYAKETEEIDLAKSVCEVFAAVASGEHPPLYYNEYLEQFRKEPDKFAEFMEIYIRDVLIYKVAKNSQSIICPWENYIKKIATKCSFDRLGRIRECHSKLKDAIELKIGFDNIFDILFTEIGGSN